LSWKDKAQISSWKDKAHIGKQNVALREPFCYSSTSPFGALFLCAQGVLRTVSIDETHLSAEKEKKIPISRVP
jgi:hypothetical protein